MKKITTLVLMLCLTLSGALCYANGAARTENEKGRDGISIEVIQASTHGVYMYSIRCGEYIHSGKLMITK